jgi:hypothetical protein
MFETEEDHSNGNQCKAFLHGSLHWSGKRE